jgi:spermidine synthase
LFDNTIAIVEKCEIDAVEIDEQIKHVAIDWFGLKEDDKVRIYIDDGLRFVESAAGKGMCGRTIEELEYRKTALFKGQKWDILILDVNSGDQNCDLWCPTSDFVQREFLSHYKTILNDDGWYNTQNILNSEHL